MPDYGHDLIFGTFLTPSADEPRRVIELAQLTEQVGLELVSVQDHPYHPRFLDAWTLLSVLAASTSRVRMVPNVLNLPLRPPAVLARSAASLDLISGGRVELGLGAGAFWDAIAGQDGPRRTPSEAVAALAEAIQVIRALWAPGGRVRFDGRYYHLHDAAPGPVPAHDIGISIGAIKPRMLRLTGQLADGWLPSSPYVAPERLAAANRLIDEAATEAGRSPSAVRRLYNIVGRFSAAGNGFLDGPPKLWAEQLAELTLTEGISGYIVMVDSADIIERFAGEVVPAVREFVATERAGGTEGSVRTTSDGEARPSTQASPVRATARIATGPLAVTPTSDDGVRRSDVRVWDETTRPTGPAPDSARRYTPHEQAAGRHLVDVHDHLRTELTQVRDLVAQVLAGSTDPGVARSHLNTMTMRQNNWTLGAYCESYCRIVTTHHTLEDQSVFPYLRRADARLAPVLDRLEEEHHAIHGVIERLDRALVGFVTGPDGAAELRTAVDLLTDTLSSHLSYEERELVEPLARLGFG
ncbi:LLM class flavin-dependent oxidoreductase [Actinopolymorpha alba]|uniref:LLM class flavin-dependent oxidoreductase n=1 Tax=Actinopolymorpha alba TaxID=533267 RepID=UPI000364CE16|nr:LLM class flavin-dependent oxidoreductase [Actinopolymorpha alba]